MPVIAGAPGFVRPLIVRSVRTGLDRALQERLVPIVDHEADWKLAAGYQATDARKDDAYVLAANEKGRIVAKWRGSGKSPRPGLEDVLQRYSGA